MPVCSKCRKEKPVLAFAVRKDTRVAMRRKVCISCRSQDVLTWKHTHRQRTRELNRLSHLRTYQQVNARRRARYAEKPIELRRSWARSQHQKHKIKIAAYSKQYRARPGVKEQARLSALAWRQRNRGRARANVRCRDVARIAATPKWANRYCILIIYRLAVAFKMEVDHIYPLQSARGCGLHVEDNLQLLPARENRQKHNHWPDAYIAALSV